MTDPINSINPKQRYIILDCLRGIALLGICLANLPEFSLYTFLPDSVTSAMPTSKADTIVKYFQYIFIDGKFYTLFSLLFGIGFSIILSNAKKNKRNGIVIFYRRMSVLLFIGLFHMLFLWAGDILMLYALMGFLLPLFRNTSDKKLLIYAVILLLLPIVIDAGVEVFDWNLSTSVINTTAYFHEQFGITKENFPIWLVESRKYIDVLKFNWAGFFIRMQEFIDGNRAFKVLGLFLIGLYIGRKGIYMNLTERKTLLTKGLKYGSILGFPLSLLYAWSSMNAKPLGLAIHSAIYAFSVVPLCFAYISTIYLFYIQRQNNLIFKLFAVPGRMALTNYLMQSVFGIIIFYGIGWGLGAKLGLVYVELIAIVIFCIQIIYSYLWLQCSRLGPLEWIWRMITYRKWIKILR